MKIAVIIPDRGDRPDFLAHCKWMLSQQTLQPDQVIIVDEKPKSEACDITYRYRTAYRSLDGQGFDCALFMENDDWYSKDYILGMLMYWQDNGKPDLFGIGYTYYYNLAVKKYTRFDHPRRASMMNTLMKTDMQFEWCSDEYPYTDMWLWTKAIENRKTFIPFNVISIGIKHGVGMSGGNYHNNKLERYDNDDNNFEFLSSVVDPVSLGFYKDLSEKLSQTK